MIVNVGKNILSVRDRNRKWYLAHRQERLKKMREYYYAHQEKNRKYREEYYRKHKEEIIKKNGEYEKNHREQAREYHRKQYWGNKEKESKRKKRFYAEKREEILKRQRERYWMIKSKVVNMLGGRCVRCGATDLKVLQINHKNGNNGKEKCGVKLLTRIFLGKRGIEDLELRCANCNFKYEYERGRCGLNNTPQKRYYRKMKDKVVEMLGGKCVVCGIQDKEVLQVNHKEMDGKFEEHRSGNMLYQDIVKGRRGIEDLDLRCANCNFLYNSTSELGR